MVKKKIMIVDDQEDIVELVRVKLGKEGFDVIGVNSGKECLEKLKEVKPDLILMDMLMPGMSGRETTEKIRDNPKTKNLKIAFLTVCKFSGMGKKTLKKLKVLDYIIKDFNKDGLVERVRKLVS